MKISVKDSDRFWSKVKKTKTCWLWLASLNGSGYGQFSYKGKPRKAHRISYELIKGRIPKKLTLDHLCRVRRCVNPKHLEVVTLTENKLRGIGPCAVNARKTHCKHGHEFTEGNTGTNNRNQRFCRLCKRETERQMRIKNPEYDRQQYQKRRGKK